MNADQFDNTLTECLQRKPFSPFVILLNDGRRFEFNEPSLAMSHTGASFLTPEYDLIEFHCEEVEEIKVGLPEIAK